jgi:hypothetical protein
MSDCSAPRVLCIYDLKRGHKITFPLVIIIIIFWITQVSWPPSIQPVIETYIPGCAVLVTVWALCRILARAFSAVWAGVQACIPHIVILDRRERLLFAQWS